MKKKIILAAGTGFLGQSILNYWPDGDTAFVILTRQTIPNKQNTPNNISYCQWDGKTLGNWVKELEGAEAVINLAGRTVNCRYNEKNKRQIVESRVCSTQAIGQAINQCQVPPKVWINAGSAAIYGNRFDEVLTEKSSNGSGFSQDVCIQWEAAFNQAATPQTRKIYYRIGLVLGPGKGLLEPFVMLARLGLCGTQGSGQQYLSWIHAKDFVNSIYFALNNPAIEGIYNCSAPTPVTNRKFTETLSQVVGSWARIPTYSWMIRIGAVFIGTEPELILDGRRVIPERLTQSGFEFKYSYLKPALQDIMEHW